ncbi:MAG TPA: transglutaminase-like domain-containing protein [Bacteroidales bacterium]|nr:transglutaminase-like domain-containing protein [Bacteroidales bacterium]HSA44406.1 transglutaminase-like domain-containing protein [Bacteroidales bacterium]
MKKLLLTAITLTLFFSSCHREERLIRQVAYRAETDRMFDKTRELAKGRDTALFGVLDSGLTSLETDAMRFLLAFAPLSDLADYDGKFFLKEVRASLKAREEMPWGRSIPEAVFLHFVLPLRVNNENLDTFRSAVYPELRERVRGLSMQDAALEINHWCHEKVTYRGSDERTSAPLATMRTSWGRCGEESTFTVAALRAAGIPARQVYTPRWAHTDDNHAWVEVWIDGKWHFMGACEPAHCLDKGWFEEPAKRTMLVHARVYGPYFGHEPVIQRQERFSELNLIQNYADAAYTFIRVTDSSGRPVRNATVEFRLFNYAEFFPILKTTTAKDGKTSALTGKGDLLIWATDGSRIAWQKVKAGSGLSIELQLVREPAKDSFVPLDIVPPARPDAAVEDSAGIAANKLRLSEEDRIRSTYMKSFRDSVSSTAFAVRYGLQPDSIRSILIKSYGNYRQIEAFLSMTAPASRALALQFLYTLTDKDLRDTEAAVLLDHFRRRPADYYSGKGSDHGLYMQYVASPRIANELIRPWRKVLTEHFSALVKGKDKAQSIAAWIRDSIRLDDFANLHSRAPLSPAGVLALRVCDARSRNIFFTAACRSLGIAARVNPVDGRAEAMSRNGWRAVEWENPDKAGNSSGTLSLLNRSETGDPRYMQHFTLSKLHQGRLQLLEFTEGRKLSDWPERFDLESGTYLLTTGKRMADGGVLAGITFFDILPAKHTDLPVIVREPVLQLTEAGHFEPGSYGFTDLISGEKLTGLPVPDGEACFLLWIDPLQEPSRHILADIPPFRKELDEWKGKLIFLLPESKSVHLPEPASMRALPAASRFLADSGNLLLTHLESKLGKSLQNMLPLVFFVTADNRVFLVSSGYAIGTGEVMSRLIRDKENRKNL